MEKFIKAMIEFQKNSRETRFIEEQKKIATTINAALSQNYLNDGNEIDLVKGTIAALNKTHGGRFRLESFFIHGNRSQVQFDYYGKIAQKEMGDLILVSTMTYMSKPILQKMTIVQAKKDTYKARSSWAIDLEQLHFLSTWPIFTGIKGIFPKTKNVIIDNSGCMGSYILYRDPGDFVFIAAPTLCRLLGSKKRINMNEIGSLQSSSIFNSTALLANQLNNLFLSYEPELLYELLRNCRRGLLPLFFQNINSSPVLGNQLIALNVSDTVNHLSLLSIGELIFSVAPNMGINENAYRLLNTVLRYIRQHHNEIGDLDLYRFMPEDAPVYEQLDMRGISIGLIHTISEVGQG